jgi:hypothetical protein
VEGGQALPEVEVEGRLESGRRRRRSRRGVDESMLVQMNGGKACVGGYEERAVRELVGMMDV